MENNINKYLVSVKDLFAKKFIVPSFQRGFRWTKYNISQIINDILESNNSDYNLHVLSIYTKKEEDGEVNIIIDGQQRVTVIYLIISYLNLKVGSQENLEIEYESRHSSKKFLKIVKEKGEQLLKIENGNDLNNFLTENNIEDNIDFRYIIEAYKEISIVMDKNVKDKNSDSESEEYKNIYTYLIEKCKFIWFSVDIYNRNDEIGFEEKIFSNINMGKIELVDSELIKSEFMNPKYYDDKNYRCDILSISKKWNEIEKSLKKPDFWNFIPHKEQYLWNMDRREVEERNIYLSRIDEIFMLFVIKKLKDVGKNYYEEWCENCQSKLFVYEKFKEWIESNEENKPMISKWNEIEKLYSNVMELYDSDGRKDIYHIILNNKDDCNVYNLVTYLIYFYTKNLKKEVYERGEVIIELIMTSRNKRKKVLKEKIKKEFYDMLGVEINENIKVEINENIKDTLKDNIQKKILELKYIKGTENIDIKSILLLFNVILLQKNRALSSRYDFLSYNNWSIEHIFAQNEKKYINDANNRECTLYELSEKIKKIEKEFAEHNTNLENIKEESKKNMLKCKSEDGKNNIINQEKRKKDEITEKIEKNKKELEKMIHEFEQKKRDVNVKRRQIIDSISDFFVKNKNLSIFRPEINGEGYKIKEEIIYISELYKKFENIKQILKEDSIKESKPYRDYWKKNTVNKLIYQKKEDIVKKIFKYKGINFNDIFNHNNEFLTKLIEKFNFDKEEDIKNINSFESSDEIINFIITLFIEGKLIINIENDIIEYFKILEKVYDDELERYFDCTHNNLFCDNNIYNLSLLRNIENRNVGNLNYSEKKRIIYEYINNGTAIPYSTLLVFTDKYLDLDKVDSGERWQWLLESRKKYFDDIIDTIFNFFEDGEINDK